MPKRLKFTLIFCLTSFIGVISGCSFQKELPQPYPLSATTLSTLNGTYQIKDKKADSVTKRYWMYNNFLTEIDRKLLSDTLVIDSLKSYKFNLTILPKNMCKISYVENDIIIRERVLKTKLKKDGYLYLKNKNLGFIIIPYLAGALDIKKTRLSASEDGNLIFDVVHHRSGAFALFIFLDGRTWHYRQEYKRVNED